MKKLLQLILIAVIALVAVEVRDDLRAATASTRLATGGTLPTKCQVGDAYYKTGTSTGLYLCAAADTWGSGGMLVRTATLTNAQIKALPTTPVTVLAAPGAGTEIKVFAATLIVDATAGAYTGMNTSYASIQLQTPSGNWLTTPFINDNTITPNQMNVTTMLSSAFIAIRGWLIPFVGPNGAPDMVTWLDYSNPTNKADVNNAAVQIGMDNNSSGNLGGGNAANSAKVIVYYAVEAL